MPTTPTPDSSWKKLVGAGVFLSLVLVACLVWSRMKFSETTRNNPASSQSTASSATANAPAGSRSRMIEADPSDTSLAAKDNAANDWREAFALAEKLTDREKNIIKGKPPLDPPATEEEIAALLAKIDPIILLLRQGAAKPGCDWGIHALSGVGQFAHLQ